MQIPYFFSVEILTQSIQISSVKVYSMRTAGEWLVGQADGRCGNQEKKSEFIDLRD